ncbi:MAG: LruC domain-containing protein [Bacteroidia bacterium]|nr:LruC domain-containing protein [Bacteroidia bacterium]
MKRLGFLLLFSACFGQVNANVNLTCESGNRGVEIGNCWAFGANTYTNTSANVISGSWSCKSNQLTSSSVTASWVKSPWIKFSSGNITFKAKFDNATGTSRGVKVFYIPYNSSASGGEGTAVQFYDYTFPTPFPTSTVKNFTIAVPSAIANSSSSYKIRISFIGTGGNSRIITDDYVFPGTYWSDPSRDCEPKNLHNDNDNDGTCDDDDDDDDDENVSSISYYPSQNGFGTLAFEDQWPQKGEYDLNDVVVNYKIATSTNSNNKVVEINATFILRATGAGFHNGFGFQLDGIASNKITSVSGTSVSNGSIYSFNANGTEESQTYANIIVFDDFYKNMAWPGGGIGINTDPSAPFVPHDTIQVKIVFINNGVVPSGGTVSISQLSSDKFNFYIVSDQERGREVHLADKAPSDKANMALFGTEDDRSSPANGKFYRTENNLPWAINVLQGFDYPKEKNPVNEAYLHFIDWARSSGTLYPNWFSNTAGYRNTSKIY